MFRSLTERPSTGIVFALTSAVLFGASTPVAKLLLGNGIDPWLLAGLLYASSGLGLAVVIGTRRLFGVSPPEAGLQGADLPWLGAAIVAGGMVAPVLLMLGLQGTPASAASLLLNLESLGTLLIAWLIFGEHVNTRLAVGAGAILLGAVVVSWLGQTGQTGWGSLAIAGACLGWAVDNNLTRKVSAVDPLQIAMWKGLAAGAINLLLALAAGALAPSFSVVASAAVVGFFGYGLSLVMFVLALRYLGVARTGAYYTTAPFIGALVSLVLLAEPVSVQLLTAAVLMGIGLWLHLTEDHEHRHRHAEQDHEHRHSHDTHHRHEHRANDPPGEPHSHRHVHKPMLHAHPHYPDLHHRHDHGPADEAR